MRQLNTTFNGGEGKLPLRSIFYKISLKCPLSIYTLLFRSLHKVGLVSIIEYQFIVAHISTHHVCWHIDTFINSFLQLKLSIGVTIGVLSIIIFWNSFIHAKIPNNSNFDISNVCDNNFIITCDMSCCSTHVSSYESTLSWITVMPSLIISSAVSWPVISSS